MKNRRSRLSWYKLTEFKISLTKLTSNKKIKIPAKAYSLWLLRKLKDPSV
ncbi:MAG: hypothetical protein PHD23_02885 [Eubacteriales bacterium]|nr:hypothetical protein [Eubacteriales bacterium]